MRAGGIAFRLQLIVRCTWHLVRSVNTGSSKLPCMIGYYIVMNNRMRYDAQDMLYEDDKRLVGKFFLQESERLSRSANERLMQLTLGCGYSMYGRSSASSPWYRHQGRPFIHDLAIKRHFHPFVMILRS
jgi:hypothetical protein